MLIICRLGRVIYNWTTIGIVLADCHSRPNVNYSVHIHIMSQASPSDLRSHRVIVLGQGK